jgi:hypothetical protein
MVALLSALVTKTGAAFTKKGAAAAAARTTKKRIASLEMKGIRPLEVL